MSTVPKVLFVRFSSLGDVVLTTSAVEALAAAQPEARIDFLTKKTFAPLLECNPHVDEVLTLEEGEGIASVSGRVAAKGYDWIIDLHGTLRTSAMKFLVRKPRWSVYRKDRMGRRLKALRHSRSQVTPPHVVDRYLAALSPLGVSAPRVLPKLYPTEAELSRVETLLRQKGWDGSAPLVALAPGARWKTKAWPRRHWEELIPNLAGETAAQPVVIGGGDDARLCEDISKSTGAISVAGELSLLESAALIGRSALLVSNDSAPLHIATAVGTPVVALFGPTVEDFGFYPIGELDRILGIELECRPCHVHGSKECPKEHHRCMEELAPAEVLENARALFDEVASQRGAK